MLLINQRLDKLTAAQVDFEARGMLCGTMFSQEDHLDNDNDIPPHEDAIGELNNRQRELDWGIVQGPRVEASVKLTQ